MNSTGVADPIGTCNTLFEDVVTTSGTKPTDTLQAAVYMSLNPTSNNGNGSTANLAALYALVTAQAAPYVGVAVQPTDWTIGIQYTDQTAATFLLDPQNIAVDSTGNIWVANGTSPASLVEMTPNGVPTANGLSATTLSGTSPRNIAIDTNNNVWVTTSSSSAIVFEYTNTGTTNSTTTSKSSYGIAIDGNNNVFVGMASTTDHYSLVEYPGGDMTKGAVFQTGSATPGTPGTSTRQDGCQRVGLAAAVHGL